MDVLGIERSPEREEKRAFCDLHCFLWLWCSDRRLKGQGMGEGPTNWLATEQPQ